jgi:ankyrin repeat protein
MSNLVEACQSSLSLASIRDLLDSGKFDLDFQDKDRKGKTALIAALQVRREDVAMELLSRGADPDQVCFIKNLKLNSIYLLPTTPTRFVDGTLL